ncbi:hypothetical protein D3C77_717480 [compost metagenome]
MPFRIQGEEGFDILALDAFQRDIAAPVIAQQRPQTLGVGPLGTERIDKGRNGLVGTGEGALLRRQGRNGQRQHGEEGGA